jgi:hypothetical protein
MNHHAQNAPRALTISDISIRQDEEGRYCLNDLHRASGEEQRHRPKYWLENQQVIDLIGFIRSEASIGGIPPILAKQGLGTFVCRELVYAYAMWISPAFHLKVIRAYDALLTQPPAAPAPEPEISATLQAALCREAYQLASDGYDGILAELTERARHYLRNGISENDILDCLKRKGFGRASPIQPRDLKPLLAQAGALFNHINDLVEGGGELCAQRLR